MRKIFDAEFRGQDPDAWAKSWSGAQVSFDVLSSGGNSYLYYIFKRYFKKKVKILEGGCGTALNVIYYKQTGMDIIGIDFSQEVIMKIKLQYLAASLCVGRVEGLPFKGGYFDLYYSGGVVEHFEEGPFRALREANRVLKDKGVLIITVPFINVARTINDLFHSFMLGPHENADSRLKRGYIVADKFIEPYAASAFHMYAFNMMEFRKILEDCGFKVLFSHGCSIEWGMREFKLINFILKKFKRRSSGEERRECIKQNVQNSLWKRLLKDIFIYERRDKVCLFPFVSLLRTYSVIWLYLFA